MKLIHKLYKLLRKPFLTNRDKIFRLSINELHAEHFPDPEANGPTDEEMEQLKDKTLHPFSEETSNSTGYHILPNGKKFFVKTITHGEPELNARREIFIHQLGKQTGVPGLGGARTLRTERGHSHTLIMPFNEHYPVWEESLIGNPQTDEEMDESIKNLFKHVDKDSLLKNYFLNFKANVGDRHLGNIGLTTSIPIKAMQHDFEYAIGPHDADNITWHRHDPTFHYYIKHHPEKMFSKEIIKPFLKSHPYFMQIAQSHILKPFYRPQAVPKILDNLQKRHHLLQELHSIRQPTFNDIVNMHNKLYSYMINHRL